MADFLLVHVLETIEYLLYEVLDVGQGDRFFILFSDAQLILKTTLTVLHDDVLYKSLLLVERVEKLDELDNIWLSFEQTHHFVFARDDVASLLSSLDGHFHVSVQIEGLEDKTYIVRLEMSADSISVGVMIVGLTESSIANHSYWL